MIKYERRGITFARITGNSEYNLENNGGIYDYGQEN